MAKSIEGALGTERKGKFLGAWKRLNKVSAAVLGSAGIIFEQPLLLGLAAIDIGQVWAIGKYEKWRTSSKTTKKLGGLAIAGARA